MHQAMGASNGFSVVSNVDGASVFACTFQHRLAKNWHVFAFAWAHSYT